MGTEKDRFHRRNTTISCWFLMPPARQMVPRLLSSFGCFDTYSVPFGMQGGPWDSLLLLLAAACMACMHLSV